VADGAHAPTPASWPAGPHVSTPILKAQLNPFEIPTYWWSIKRG
jgi:hypothetical protein